MSDDTLNLIGDLIGFVGLFALMVAAFPGEALAARRGHGLGVFTGGRAFFWHWAVGASGLALFFLHPIPFLFRMKNYHLAFPTYLATIPLNGWKVDLGIGAFYLLLVTAVTALLTRYVSRSVWRTLHWLTYAMLALGTAHGFVLSGGGEAWARAVMIALSVLGAAVLGTRVWLALTRDRAIPVRCQRAAAARLHLPVASGTPAE